MRLYEVDRRDEIIIIKRWEGKKRENQMFIQLYLQLFRFRDLAIFFKITIFGSPLGTSILPELSRHVPGCFFSFSISGLKPALRAAAITSSIVGLVTESIAETILPLLRVLVESKYTGQITTLSLSAGIVLEIEGACNKYLFTLQHSLAMSFAKFLSRRNSFRLPVI
jgi:hypothetical protein